MDEGLDRHEAIHAISSVLATFIHALMTAPKSGAERNAPYFAALERLTQTTGGDHSECFCHSHFMEGIMFAILRGAKWPAPRS